MANTYQIAPSDALHCMQSALNKYHYRLIENGVSIALLALYSADGEPALMCHGAPAYAVTRILPLKLRAHGLADAEITIDFTSWMRLSDPKRMAVMDHELTHIRPVFEDGICVRDDLGRPKLKLRDHDFQFGWFNEVAERHRESSIEVEQASQIINTTGQLYFEFPKV